MTRRSILSVGLVAGLALGLVAAVPAEAAVTLKNTSVSCTLTANLPVLSKTKQLTGSATISCIAYRTSTVQVTVQVVELNGATVNPLGNAFLVASSKTLSVSSKAVSWTVTTPAKACVNTDGTGTGAAFEDYQTVALISVGTSVVDRISKVDYWNC